MDAGEKEQLQIAFGKVIRSLRSERDISQIELSERGGFNRTYISDLERGKNKPPFLRLFAFLMLLVLNLIN